MPPTRLAGQANGTVPTPQRAGPRAAAQRPRQQEFETCDPDTDTNIDLSDFATFALNFTG